MRTCTHHARTTHMLRTCDAPTPTVHACGVLRAYRLARVDRGPPQHPEHLRDERLQQDAGYDHDERVLHRGHIPQRCAVAVDDGRLDE